MLPDWDFDPETIYLVKWIVPLLLALMLWPIPMHSQTAKHGSDGNYVNIGEK